MLKLAKTNIILNLTKKNIKLSHFVTQDKQNVSLNNKKQYFSNLSNNFIKNNNNG